MVRWIGRGVLVALLGAAVFLVPTIWGKPWSIDHFFLRSLIVLVIDHPMLLSLARPLDAFDLDFYSDELEDFSVEDDLAVAEAADEILAGLREYDRDAEWSEQGKIVIRLC